MHRPFGEVGINEIAEDWQDRTDHDRRHPPQPREGITAEADAEHGHEDTEDLRRERHLVLRILQEIQVERKREAGPDVVAQRIGQDQPEHDQHPPADPPGQFRQRRDQRRIQVIGGGPHRA